ncbi:MAG: SPOR domain-containing protein [Pseudomonadota bacterium]
MDWVKQKTESAHTRQAARTHQAESRQAVAASAGQRRRLHRARPWRTLLAGSGWLAPLAAAGLAGSFHIPAAASHTAFEDGLASVFGGTAAASGQPERRDHPSERMRELYATIGAVGSGLHRTRLLSDTLPAADGGPAQSRGIPDPSATSPAGLQLASRVNVVPRPVVQNVDGSDITDTESKPLPDTPTAAGRQDTPAAPESGAARPAAANGTVPAAVPTVTGEPATAPAGGAENAWVINLASMQSQSAAEAFAARVRASAIAVELQAVNVKGKDFWRVQAVGFATAEAARAQVDTIKQRLDLKEVWVTRR